jgi:hypothetical protein
MANIQQTRENFPSDIANALDAIVTLKTDVTDAHDALLSTKVAQAHAANAHRAEEPTFNISDLAYLLTTNRHREYLTRDSKCTAKFMPRYDGPYKIISANPESSTYTLNLPEHTHIYPTFHVSKLKCHIANDTELFPSRETQQPKPFVTTTGAEEWEIERILDCQARGRGYQYLICWRDYGLERDVWVAGQELQGTEALKAYNNIPENQDELDPLSQQENTALEDQEQQDTSRSVAREDNHNATQNSSESGRV